MKSKWQTSRRMLVAALCLFGSGAAWTKTNSAQPVDLIFFNGTIITPQGDAEAVAVRGAMIVAVGSRQEIMKLPHAASAEIDLAGRTLMPGLYDSHAHLYLAGKELTSCKFPRGSNAKVIVETVKICAAKAKPGEWITGGSWVGAKFKPGEQTRALLDKAAPNNPVLLDDESLHSVWVNSRALELAGVTSRTTNPQGGVIDRDRTGEPTGVLRETAAQLVEKMIPNPSLDQQVAAVKASTDAMLGLGIVGITDAGVRSSWIEGFAQYARSGQLKQYSRGCLSFGNGDAEAERMIANRLSYEAGRLRFDCVKLMLDGVPIESRTAAMLEPYSPRSHSDSAGSSDGDKGILLFSPGRLSEIVTRFDRLGVHVKMHAAGDGSVREAANAIAAARATNGFIGPRHDIAHNTFIDRSDVARARDLGFAWEFSPYIWWPTPITAVDITNAVGPERMQRLWPVKDAIESGAAVVIGSDWPVVPSANPWLALETLITRQVPGATGQPIGEGQRISRTQALQLLTGNGAAVMGRLDRGGSIEIGKLADMIIVDRNPMTAPVGELHQTRVLKTFISGELVFSAPGY